MRLGPGRLAIPQFHNASQRRRIINRCPRRLGLIAATASADARDAVRALELRHRKHEPGTGHNDLAELELGAKADPSYQIGIPDGQPVDMLVPARRQVAEAHSAEYCLALGRRRLASTDVDGRRFAFTGIGRLRRER